jgi:hypothetical protein
MSARWVVDVVFVTVLAVSGLLIFYYFDRPPGVGLAVPGQQGAAPSSPIPGDPFVSAITPLDAQPPGTVPPQVADTSPVPAAPHRGGAASPPQPSETFPELGSSRAPQTPRALARKTLQRPQRRPVEVRPDLGRTANDLYRVVVE